MPFIRKASVLILSSFFIIFNLSPVFAVNADCQEYFTDVKSNNIFCKYIEYLVKQEVFSKGEEFNPDDNITRGQFSKIVRRAFNVEIRKNGEMFNDVNEGDTFFEDIMTLKNENSIGGYTDGTFRPDDSVSRGAASKILISMVMNNIKVKFTNEEIKFTDISDSKFKQYIEKLARLVVDEDKKIISGYKDNTFKPDENLSRAQAAKMISNLIINLDLAAKNCSESYCQDLVIGNLYPISEQELEDYMLQLINETRKSNNLPELNANIKVETIAKDWAKHMAETDNLEHNLDLTKKMQNAGIKFSYNGENVATRTVSDKDNAQAHKNALKTIHEAMLAETPPNDQHRRILLNQEAEFTQVGIAVVIEKDQYDPERNRIWLVEDFISIKE